MINTLSGEHPLLACQEASATEVVDQGVKPREDGIGLVGAALVREVTYPRIGIFMGEEIGQSVQHCSASSKRG